MIKKTVLLTAIFCLMSACVHSSAGAIYDPRSVPNNTVGVHILEPSEVFEAAKLINSSGGDWGYVTIPIRSDDKKPEKWLEFFKNCRQLHIIPIVRLTTYVDRQSWQTPTVYDLVDFANFLNDMPWPTNNRYVLLFNEPNHAKEWGGYVSPGEYAKLLVDAKNIFKSRSGDFFLLTAGLDMSAPTNATSLDALQYYRQMTAMVPKWIDSVDGLSVHAYANPGFSASVWSTTRYGPKSFEYEVKYLSSLGLSRATQLPIFISEAGSHATSGFYIPAFSQVWTSQNIIAITPFILFAASPDFQAFSLVDAAHQPKPSYNEIKALAKKTGSPLLNPNLPPINDKQTVGESAPKSQDSSFLSRLKNIFHPQPPVLNMTTLALKDQKLAVEVADTQKTREHGLSDRQNMPEDHGMFFIFPQSDNLVFWMKDMHFPLDIIWIDGDKVVGFVQNVPPPDQTSGIPRVVQSETKANRVLEVNAGFVSQHNLQIGDKAVLDVQ